MTTPKVITWHHCYDKQSKNMIIQKAMQHPAKMAMGLCERIFEFMEKEGMVARGDTIVDPFGGIGMTGIVGTSRGFRVLCVELEQKFVAITEANFKKHERTWELAERNLPGVVRGDSRNLRALLQGSADAVLSSPPYCQMEKSGGKAVFDQLEKKHGRKFTEKTRRQGYRRGDATTEGQIGNMPAGAVGGVITSPPWDNNTQGHVGAEKFKNPEDFLKAGRGHGASDEARLRQLERDQQKTLGDTEGQISQLPSGSVDGVITSPPYADKSITAQKNFIGSGSDKGTPAGKIRLKDKGYDAIVTSPPYSETMQHGRHGIDFTKAKKDYPGRVQHAERTKDMNKRHAEQRYAEFGASPKNIGNLSEGQGVDGILTSPPFNEDRANVIHGKGKGAHTYDANESKARMKKDYVKPTDPKSIGRLKVDGVVTSPPYENASATSRRGKDAHPERLDGPLPPVSYGKSKGQIGNTSKETYWQAMCTVYEQCYQTLRPGRYIAVVVKDFVRNKQLVPLCDNTVKLLTHVGFDAQYRIRASLVHDLGMEDMFTGKRKVKERKSFFRRLAEKKGGPRIDYEEVLIAQKNA